MQDESILFDLGLTSHQENYKITIVLHLKGDIGEFDSNHLDGICNEALIDGLQTVDIEQIKNMKVQF